MSIRNDELRQELIDHVDQRMEYLTNAQSKFAFDLVDRMLTFTEEACREHGIDRETAGRIKRSIARGVVTGQTEADRRREAAQQSIALNPGQSPLVAGPSYAELRSTT